MTAAEAELLAVLAEECGEVIQAIGKILRHGWHSCPPAGGRSNQAQLTLELGDVAAVTALLVRADLLDESLIAEARIAKLERIHRYLHHTQARDLPE